MGTTHAHTSDTWQNDIVGCHCTGAVHLIMRRNNISRCHTGIFHFKRFEEEKSCKRLLYAILHQVYRDQLQLLQMGSISSRSPSSNQPECNCFFFRFFSLLGFSALWCGGENVMFRTGRPFYGRYTTWYWVALFGCNLSRFKRSIIHMASFDDINQKSKGH